jgi:hypothetical protein
MMVRLLAITVLLASCALPIATPVPGTGPGAPAPEKAAEIAAAFGPDGTDPQPWYGRITSVRWSETGGRLIVSGGFGAIEVMEICDDVHAATRVSGITIQAGVIAAVCDFD